VGHGLKIIEAIAGVAREKKIAAAIKFQFRQLKSFLHPGFLEACLPNSSNKHTKRFLETQLDFEDYQRMVECVRRNDLIPFATPFDEASVDWCDRLDLLSSRFKLFCGRLALAAPDCRIKTPVVCSTGGLSLRQIDEAGKLFQQARDSAGHYALCGHLSCANPSLTDGSGLPLRRRYGDLVIGYSHMKARPIWMQSH